MRKTQRVSGEVGAGQRRDRQLGEPGAGDELHLAADRAESTGARIASSIRLALPWW
jgi:hypothetical protein